MQKISETKLFQLNTLQSGNTGSDFNYKKIPPCFECKSCDCKKLQKNTKKKLECKKVKKLAMQKISETKHRTE